MSLIICPECKKEISSSAIVCVHCGRPIAQYKKAVLTEFTDGKLTAIKGIRETLDYGLADAKRLSENAPCNLATGLTLEECEKLRTQLEEYCVIIDIVDDLKSEEHNDVIERLEAERLSGARPPLYRRPRCPVCGLPEIKMVERKVPVFFGLFKKTKIVSVCKACGFELI